MILLNQDSFPYLKTLLIALIGAVIGQSLMLFIEWIKRRIKLSRKKQMIFNDLKDQSKTLDLSAEKHIELDGLFEKRTPGLFKTSIFHTLQLDIYQSVPKHELHSIFKNELAVLVDIYKSIEFIKNNGPYWIYKDYLEKWELHQKEKIDEPDHKFYCDTHLRIIYIARQNIESNLKSIKETKRKIDKLTKKTGWF